MITLKIPMPPPLSACFSNVPGRGRVKSARYKLWAREANAEIYSQVLRLRRPDRSFDGDVKATFLIRRPDRRRRDLDNLGKALCDVLRSSAVLHDDSQIVDLRFAWADVDAVEARVEAA